MGGTGDFFLRMRLEKALLRQKEKTAGAKSFRPGVKKKVTSACGDGAGSARADE